MCHAHLSSRRGPLSLPEKSPVARPADRGAAEWPSATPLALTADEAGLGVSDDGRRRFESQVALADRKMAALEEWRTVGREVNALFPKGLFLEVFF